MIVKKGDWVEIENTILNPDERSTNLPDSTKKTPLKMWVRGFLLNEEAELNDDVELITLASRKVSGKLIEFNPRHVHDYGDTVIELIQIGEELKNELLELLEGGEN